MSAALKSYVEKYLLNPGASFNLLDEDGNQDAEPEVVGALPEGEGAKGGQVSVSKLRARSAALQMEKDPRYRGKKVSRQDLKKDQDVEFDPELTKYFLIEGEEEDEDGGGSEAVEGSDEDGGGSEAVEGSDEDGGGSEVVEGSDEDGGGSEAVEGSDEDGGGSEAVEGSDEGSRDENDDNENIESDEELSSGDEAEEALGQASVSKPAGVRFVDDGDFSKFADIDEEDEEGEDDDDGGGGSDEEMEFNEDDKPESSLRKFSSEDQSGELKKGQAVKNQLALYDSLFEGRISLQKVVSGTNQLPQRDTYKLFLQQKDLHYSRNLLAAKSAARHLLNTLIHLQELLLKQNPETSYIITGKKPKSAGTESDEEITSSEDEVEEEEESGGKGRGLKRKMKLEECEAVLSKRHAAMIPFRDHTINKWYEKTKLLSSHSAGNKFSGFETSALQQLHNLLSNKQQLVQRTRLTGTARGTTYQVLGHPPPSSQAQPESEEYDPEIYDDTDFYARCLEEVLKSKVALSDNMTDVSRKWIEIQNLRRKAKRRVDQKASKGRKIRYEVMSKVQQYLAPCLPSLMDDAAINTLFGSLFRKS